MSTDGFMAIGDTVPTIDPLWGEGIHKGLKSARAAASVVDSALTPEAPMTDAETMAVYDRLWHRDVAPKHSARLMMTELLYLAPNERYDELMADLRRTKSDTLEQINHGDRRAIAKLTHLSDLALLAKYAKRRLAR